MVEWLAELTGSESSLRELAKVFQSPDLSVIEIGGEYYLKSAAFAGAGEAREVRDQAITLVRRTIRGIGKLLISNLDPIRISCVAKMDDTGRIAEKIISFDVLEIVSSVENLVVVLSGKTIADLRPTLAEKWNAIADKEDLIDVALNHFAYETPDWFNLYKVYEAIRDGVGGDQALDQRQWVSRNERGRFTQTANHYRHRSECVPLPPKPMTLQEADTFIKDILRKWLDEKSSASGT